MSPTTATAANTTASACASAPWALSFEATICVVITRKLPPKMYGAEKEASEVIKVRSAAPAKAGRRSGRVTRASVRSRPAPRIAAASSIAASSRVSAARLKR